MILLAELFSDKSRSSQAIQSKPAYALTGIDNHVNLLWLDKHPVMQG